MDNYNWYLNADLKKYAGKWIAIVNEEIVAAHANLKKLTSDVTQKYSLAEISFAKVPDPSEALVY